MENILGRQLWDVYENLKKGNRIGFLTDDEFQKYFLGFISYKYLSEKLESYIGNQLRYKSLDFEEAYGDDGYRESLRERSIEDIGYFLRPDLLFKNIVSSKNYGNIIIEELEKAFNEISESSRGRESEEDFLNLFEGVDLKASQLGKTLEDKNRAVFNILDALSNLMFAGDVIPCIDVETVNKVESLSRKRSYDADLMEKNYSIESLSDSSLSKNMVSYLKEPSFNDEADYLDMDDYFYEKYIDELIGNGFEYLLSEFSLNSSNSLDYYTPKEVSKLIARLISSQKDHIRSVYDPCCGSASLLLEINKELPCDFICGQEINASFYNIARENMILHNIHYKDFDIKQGDSLEEPQHLDYTFEAIVSEIPFNSRWMADRSYLDDVRFMDYNILAPRTKADYAFIQHMLYHLDEDGIMIVVVPHGVLFRAASELAIRKQIVGRLNYLDAVIGLPANMFYSTNIPTCLMIFKKNRSWNDDVLFIDASRDFEKSKLIKYLSDKDISKIVETYRFRDEIRKYSHRASLDEIIENDFNLNIPRYVDTFEEKRMKSSKELLIEHQNIKEEIKKVTKEINMAYKELNIDNNLFE